MNSHQLKHMENMRRATMFDNSMSEARLQIAQSQQQLDQVALEIKQLETNLARFVAMRVPAMIGGRDMLSTIEGQIVEGECLLANHKASFKALSEAMDRALDSMARMEGMRQLLIPA